jgi:hypothetical protein
LVLLRARFALKYGITQRAVQQMSGFLDPFKSIPFYTFIESFSNAKSNHGKEPLTQELILTTNSGKRRKPDLNKSSTPKKSKAGNNENEKYIGHQSPLSLAPPRANQKIEQTTTYAKGKEKESNENLTCLTLAMKNKTPSYFNVQDWTFLRGDPNSVVSAERQRQCLRLFNRCKGEKNLDSFFFIQKGQIFNFLDNYNAVGHADKETSIASNISSRLQARRQKYYEILLKISDEKVNLGSYQFFTEHILQVMSQKIDQNFRAIHGPLASKEILDSTKTMVAEITKVTQLLLVIIRTFFKGHPQEVLTAEDVQKDLECIQRLWFRLEQGSVKQIEKSWETRLHQVLKLQTGTKSSRNYIGRKGKRMELCYNCLHYLLEESGSPFDRSSFRKPYPVTFSEVINKLIHLSNDETIIKN